MAANENALAVPGSRSGGNVQRRTADAAERTRRGAREHEEITYTGGKRGQGRRLGSRAQTPRTLTRAHASEEILRLYPAETHDSLSLSRVNGV